MASRVGRLSLFVDPENRDSGSLTLGLTQPQNAVDID